MKDNRVTEVPYSLLEELMKKGYAVGVTSMGYIRVYLGGEKVGVFAVREVEHALKMSIPLEKFRKLTETEEPLEPNGA